MFDSRPSNALEEFLKTWILDTQNVVSATSAACEIICRPSKKIYLVSNME